MQALVFPKEGNSSACVSSVLFTSFGSRDYTLTHAPNAGANTSMCFLLTYQQLLSPNGLSPVPLTVTRFNVVF